MSKKISLVIGGQALLIVALFWVLIFYGKDEYEAYQNSHEDEIATPNHISEKDGINIVSLSAATQQNSGITTAKVASSSFADTLKSSGSVIAIDSLLRQKPIICAQNQKSPWRVLQIATIYSNINDLKRLTMMIKMCLIKLYKTL